MSWLFTLFIYTHAAFCIGPPCLQSRLCVKSNRTPPTPLQHSFHLIGCLAKTSSIPLTSNFVPLPPPTYHEINRSCARVSSPFFVAFWIYLFMWLVGCWVFWGVFKTPKTPWSYDVHYSGIRPAGGGNTWHEPKQTNWARVSPKNDPRSPALTVRGECGEQAGIIVVCVLVWRATRWISSE